MGLLDVLNGMQNGPRGARDGNSGGMSPITMALLGLLAYKAYKKMTADQPQAAPAGNALPPGSTLPSGNALPGNVQAGTPGGGLGDILGGLLGGNTARANAAPGGGLGDILGGLLGGNSGQANSGSGAGLGGGLGGLLAGGAAGSVLSGGLGHLIDDLHRNGLGDAAHSWVGSGPNKAVSADDLASAIGVDDIDAVASQTGLSRNELAAALSEHLPQLVNHLTPDGRLPTDQELSRLV
jgi:uncharacterized protein YidB (DUF937 family)